MESQLNGATPVSQQLPNLVEAGHSLEGTTMYGISSSSDGVSLYATPGDVSPMSFEQSNISAGHRLHDTTASNSMSASADYHIFNVDDDSTSSGDLNTGFVCDRVFPMSLEHPNTSTAGVLRTKPTLMRQAA